MPSPETPDSISVPADPTGSGVMLQKGQWPLFIFHQLLIEHLLCAGIMLGSGNRGQQAKAPAQHTDFGFSWGSPCGEQGNVMHLGSDCWRIQGECIGNET